MRYIVVDVDGVLNSFDETEDSFRTLVYAQGRPFPLNLNTKHAQWLLELAEDTDSQLLWGTTWENDANEQIGKQIGLPEIATAQLGQPLFRQSSAAWKSFGVLSHVGDSVFVWFDDDHEVSYYVATSNGHHIRVNPLKGLTKEHIEQARTILKKEN